ncbi:MAG: UvrD-helicase domain-containing protein [Leptospiraceae bacterium]|nr:UvrD-helicase domain-containing protein [Leptospiraceae bacterium]MCP5497124.1 UvrD-helicase domain-containing protein [Leptospiraceae bacterium]
MNNQLLENLNPSQKAAVLQTNGPVLILAGAGSGKTRVITHRIAHLILNENVPPYKICSVTFTNKAAAEMQERVKELIPRSSEYVQIRTFHSLCLNILKRDSVHAGLQPGFTVYDTDLQESLIKQIIKDLHIGRDDIKPSTAVNAISRAKDSLILPDEYAATKGKNYYEMEIAKIYEEYEKRKAIQNGVDFGDLILKTYLMFKNSPEILQKYHDRWEYIMVDEYQDTNKIQYYLTKLLAEKHQNLCVVGDDDQSIYSWRGADINNILDFEKDFPNTFTVKLEENYRSTSNIIKAASTLIQNNIGRKEKVIFTNQSPGEKISLSQYTNDTDEAYSIIKKIQELYKQEKSYSKFAIFYRTNAQSRYFEEALRSSAIPYKIFGGFRFFDRAEIKDLLAYLAVINNPVDSSSLLRIINKPARRIGDTTIEKLRQLSIEEGISILEALNSDKIKMQKATKNKAKELYKTLEELIDLSPTNRPSSIAQLTLEKTGLLDEYKNNKNPESLTKIENLEQLINSIIEYEEESEEPSLDDYLGKISLITSEENKNESQDCIVLMTVHNSKGLEFDYVFLAGMEEGTFPHRMSMDTASELEEERRLCYVAITRARKKLFISHSEHSRRYGDIQYKIPSRFLSEIPENLIIANKQYGNNRIPEATPYPIHTKFPTQDHKTKTAVSNGGNFQISSKVLHKAYGVGKIIEIYGKGDNTSVKIQFDYFTKKFFLKYTPLELLE